MVLIRSKLEIVFHTFILVFRKWEIPFRRMLQQIHKLIYYPIFSSAICKYFQVKLEFHLWPPKLKMNCISLTGFAYLSNAVTIISFLYIYELHAGKDQNNTSFHHQS